MVMGRDSASVARNDGGAGQLVAALGAKDIASEFHAGRGGTKVLVLYRVDCGVRSDDTLAPGR